MSGINYWTAMVEIQRWADGEPFELIRVCASDWFYTEHRSVLGPEEVYLGEVELLYCRRCHAQAQSMNGHMTWHVHGIKDLTVEEFQDGG